MKILPLDIKQQQFPKAFRGYETSEVHIFLDLVAQQFEDMTRENLTLQDDIKRLQTELGEHRQRETTLKETMLTAQKLSEELKIAAKKEADLVIQEAELRGERLVSDAHQKMVKIMDEIQELKLERARLISSFHTFLQQHLRILEASAEAAAQERDVNLAFLKPSTKARAAE